MMDNTLKLIFLLVFADTFVVVVSKIKKKDFQVKLQNIIANDNNLYVGATNTIYKLDHDFKLLKSVVTGPKDDNPFCILFGKGKVYCNNNRNNIKHEIASTNNYNKILLFVKQPTNSLLSCGTLYQGICTFYDLNSLQDITAQNHTLKTKTETKFVSSNLENASAVAFVKNGGKSDMLFIARTITGLAKPFHDFSKYLMFIFARRLYPDKMFLEPVKNDKGIDFVVTYNKKFFDEAERTTYPIDYVKGFPAGDHVYFLTVQKKSLKSERYVSKVVRMKAPDAESSKKKFGYTEQIISCESHSMNYNILISATMVKLTEDSAKFVQAGTAGDVFLYGLFSHSATGNNKLNFKHYAVCIFKLQSVDTYLNAMQKKCEGKKQPIPISEITECSNDDETFLGTAAHVMTGTSLGYIFGYVHDRGIALYISSSKTMSEYAVMGNTLYQYGEVLLTENPNSLFSQIVMEPNKEYLFLKSSHALVKSQVKDCSNRNSCKDCLSGPSCGWCTLEGKCSTKPECKNTELPNYYIDESIEKCPTVTFIDPTVSSISSSAKIKLVTAFTPDVSFECSVNGEFYSVTKINSTTYECAELVLKMLPNFNPTNGADFVNVSLVTKIEKHEVVTSKITVYDCLAFSMCQSCISGQFNCGWCSKCVDDQSSCSQTWIPYSSNGDTKQCPSIMKPSTLYIASGNSTMIELEGTNLPATQIGFDYKCIVKNDGHIIADIPATRVSESQLLCQTASFSYQDEVSSINSTIVIKYGKTIIDSSSINVLMYKCHINSDDCTICLQSPSEWNCGWCLSEGKCKIKDQCINAQSWDNQICPRPVIRRFEPMETTVNGRTQITMYGSDLGISATDVNVTVADQICVIETPKTSQKIICNITADSTPTSGLIVVTVKGSNARIFTGKSREKFFVWEPIITKFYPKTGPCWGGTNVTFIGRHLNVGNRVKITISGSACEMNNAPRNPTLLTCLTKKNLCERKSRRRRRSDFKNDMIVEIDGHVVNGPIDLSFEYVSDPVITSLSTTKGLVEVKTFASGGQVFRVIGHRLHIIQNPKMTFTVPSSNLKIVVDCVYNVSSKQQPLLLCLAPNMSSAMKNNKEIQVTLGFENVDSLKSFTKITVVTDPVFYPFGDDNIRVVKTEDLILMGSGLSVLARSDVKVQVGNLPCIVTDLDERLVCTLPDEEDFDGKPETLYPVRVMVGEGGLSYNLGFIKFYNPNQDSVDIMVYVAPIVAGVIVLLIIIVILVILYRRKHKKDKQYQELVQIRMDKMESQYARECKEAFADYQTDITDLTQDVEQHIPPYHDFCGYAMRVLYPGLKTHPILEGDLDERAEWKDSMTNLIDLLRKKDFLLTFVQTLESQSSFQMTDRCIVASLLMVALQDDFGYITNILKSLLVNLIQKAGTGKRPKLLLRRTESVAEKLLTNWLAYTLHDFLQSHVGDPLFKLFTAINILLEKEPIDAITCDARNSLSEDKVLRQKIDFKPMTVNVAYVDAEEGGAFDRLPVLSCDTITQTKSKILKHIYKNKPYKDWPNIDELYLGFVSANGAVLILQDEDSTNIIENEWRKINTLEHYKVPDNASLRLADMQSMNENSEIDGTTLVHDTSALSVTYRPNHASTPMLNQQDAAREPKLWHMVKQTDYPQEQKQDIRQSKMMAEVYLTRLLKTKETLQRFVNKLFDSIFGLNEQGREIPPSVKFLFDFLDKEAENLEISDNEVHHTWKNNSLPLRFWINMIKNPEFVFDIKKSNTVDSCLSVIAQLFMDSCSPDDHRLGKDSPSNKLLYAKEIPDYKKKVKRYYIDVKQADFEHESFEQSLGNLSKKYGTTFNSRNAASLLLVYAIDHKVILMENLEGEGFSHLYDELEKIMDNVPD